MQSRFNVKILESVSNELTFLPEKARDKILYNILKSTKVIDAELLKKLTANIWEFRTYHSNTYYRLLAFWDSPESLIIVCSIFKKTTQKTPHHEIEKAENLRRQYFEEKNETSNS
jgi:phage-related protein